jgi:hypothetical protein
MNTQYQKDNWKWRWVEDHWGQTMYMMDRQIKKCWEEEWDWRMLDEIQELADTDIWRFLCKSQPVSVEIM